MGMIVLANKTTGPLFRDGAGLPLGPGGGYDLLFLLVAGESGPLGPRAPCVPNL